MRIEFSRFRAAFLPSHAVRIQRRAQALLLPHRWLSIKSLQESHKTAHDRHSRTLYNVTKVSRLLPPRFLVDRYPGSGPVATHGLLCLCEGQRPRDSAVAITTARRLTWVTRLNPVLQNVEGRPGYRSQGRILACREGVTKTHRL